MKFQDIMEKSNQRIDFNLKFGKSTDTPDLNGQIGVDEYGM
jgi:hypothetical protein